MKNTTMATSKHHASGLPSFRACVLIGATDGVQHTTVVNPGRVQEEFLLEVEAQEAIVSGNRPRRGRGPELRRLHRRSRHPGDSPIGLHRKLRNPPSSGRTANSTTRRSTPTGTCPSGRAGGATTGSRRSWKPGAEEPVQLLAEAYLWTGYAYRLLGENFCVSVIDGEGAGPRSVYYERAIARFDQAASLGSGDMAMAAVAARAAVKAFSGDWSGAMADAAGVPDNFVFDMPYFATEGNATRNRIQFASQAEPYKAHTQRYTKYEDYSMSENNPDGDPRGAVPGDRRDRRRGGPVLWPSALVAADEIRGLGVGHPTLQGHRDAADRGRGHAGGG